MIHNKNITTNPLPARRSGEKQDDFVSRCMGSETMQDEYPDQEQRLAVCYSQARRKRKAPKSNAHAEGWSMEVVPAVLANVAARMETFEGRRYQVYPVVALKEGVHRGSDGALLYPEEELEKFAEAWNGRPIPVFHPTSVDGRPISSNNPGTISTQTIGTTFNFFYDRAARALKGELWIDVEKAETVHPGLLSQMAQRMEVSTGLFSELDTTPGSWNGEEYTAVARNYRPDHLALLPGGRGACSWTDGCGVRVNTQDGAEAVPSSGFGRLSERLKALALTAMGVMIHLGKKPAGMSLEDVRRRIQDIVNSYDNPQWVNFLRAVYDDSFVYLSEPISPQPTNPGNQPRVARLFRQGYTWEGGNPTVSGEPEEVKEETRYVSVKNNAAQFNKEDIQMAENKTKPCCEEKVQMLIEHTATRFEEKDREWLLSLNEEQVDRLFPKDPPPPAGGSNEEKANPAKSAADVAANAAVAATANAGQSVDEYIAKAPAEMRGMLANAFREYKAKKAALVADLAANKNCRFTQEQLEAMESEALQNLVDLAKGSTVSPPPETPTGGGVYSGRSPAVTVMSGAEKVEPLLVPTIGDFAIEKGKKE